MVVYAQLFASACHDGFVNASSRAEGRLGWSKTIPPEGEETPNVRLLLTTDKLVFVVDVRNIYAFNNKGEYLWQMEKWYDTPVVMRGGRIFYTSALRKTRMEAVDFNNQLQIKDFWIPDVGEHAYLVLFEPVEKGLIAQVQYIPTPDEGEKSFIIYRVHEDGLGYEWSKHFNNEESPLSPIVCFDYHSLVTATQKEGLVFNIESRQPGPEPIAKFPLPFANATMWVSCGADKSLYWAGLVNSITALAATDLNGTEKWKWQSGIHLGPDRSRPVAPPIVTPERIYLLTKKYLFAVKNGRLLWKFEAKEGNFTSGTALADGTVLIAEGNKLHRVDSQGNSLFKVVMGKTIVTYPVIDEEGNIYVASSDTLYAIH